MTRRSLVAPRDTLEMPSLRDGGRRDIPWDAPWPDLAGEQRALLGHAWRWRMEQEHLAVGAFALLAYELARLGCDSVVLSLVTRAAADEVRHADICRRMAALALDEPLPAVLAGVARRAEYPGLPDADATLLRMVETCCLSETFTGVYFTEMLERTSHPTARAAVQSLLEDEIDHGRVGWAYLAAVSKRGDVAWIGDRLPELLARTMKPVLDEARGSPEPADEVLERCGYLVRDRNAAIYTGALFEVVLPGFESLGVSTGAARAFATREGWTP